MSETHTPTNSPTANQSDSEIDNGIFKAYDIRGIVDKTLTEHAVYRVGCALALKAREKGVKALVIGRDGRLSGPRLCAALAKGINRGGIDVIDIGMVPTPVVYFGTYELDTGSGVAVTGSHNPPDYNGLKMMMAGETLHGEAIQELFRVATSADLEDKLGSGPAGKTTEQDLNERYLDRITSDVKLARPMKIAMDAGNGVAGDLAPELYKRLGCEVTELFCLGLVTKDGQTIFPDRQLMLFAADVLERNPGAQIVYDVKCSRNVGKYIEQRGGEPLMWMTGHSLVKAKLRETGAPLAGEMSGHIFFKERWYGFDDGLYAGVRMLEILSRMQDPSAELNALPDSPTTPELKLETAEGENFALVEKLKGVVDQFEGAQRVVTIDGVRVEYADGFGLARPSNTTPVVVMRFEADTDAALTRIQDSFAKVIKSIAPGVKLPY